MSQAELNSHLPYGSFPWLCNLPLHHHSSLSNALGRGGSVCSTELGWIPSSPPESYSWLRARSDGNMTTVCVCVWLRERERACVCVCVSACSTWFLAFYLSSFLRSPRLSTDKRVSSPRRKPRFVRDYILMIIDRFYSLSRCLLRPRAGSLRFT